MTFLCLVVHNLPHWACEQLVLMLCSSFKKKLFIWLRQVLVYVHCDMQDFKNVLLLFLVAARVIFSCGTWDPVP